MQIGDFVANANVRTVRRLLRALVEGNAVGGDAFVSPDFLDHDAPGANNSPPRRGSVQFRESVQWIHRVFADLEFEEREVIAVDDRVVVDRPQGGGAPRRVGRVPPPTATGCGSLLIRMSRHPFFPGPRARRLDSLSPAIEIP